MSDESTKKMMELFGYEDNFLGTGMSFQEWCTHKEIKRIEASFTMQDGAEKKRRLHYIMKLSEEGAKIKAVSLFGTAWVDAAIESVIQGDWDEIEKVNLPMSDMAKAHGGDNEERKEQLTKLWTPFREVLEEAYLTRPEGLQGTKH